MKNKGFTLAEMTIVLLITSLILLIGFNFSKRTRQQLIEEQYIQNLVETMNTSMIEGRNESKSVFFRFEPSGVNIYMGGKYIKRPLPKTLKYYGTERVSISNKGVTMPKTIVISEIHNHYEYRIVFELSFGGTFRVYKKS